MSPELSQTYIAVPQIWSVCGAIHLSLAPNTMVNNWRDSIVTYCCSLVVPLSWKWMRTNVPSGKQYPAYMNYTIKTVLNTFSNDTHLVSILVCLTADSTCRLVITVGNYPVYIIVIRKVGVISEWWYTFHLKLFQSQVILFEQKFQSRIEHLSTFNFCIFCCFKYA